MQRKIPSKDGPLFYRNDEDDTRELINKMRESGRFVDRPTQFHIKHRALNYYPTRGVITIDGEGSYPERGPEAFLSLLEQRYPKRRRPCGSTPPGPTSPPPTSPPIFEIDLDDERVNPGGREGEQRHDADDLPW
ncbi:hypothetical protein ACQR0V_28265 [Bradyrhizobium sp. HKCCYLS2058]|uniref:hypothetical protein n=1 Tax=unclassified Bradyrhizobium TaxID=2631580 RepID=UPI003EC00BA6